MAAIFSRLRVHTTGEGALFYVAGDGLAGHPARAFVLQTVHPEVQNEVLTAFASTVDALPDTGLVLTDDSKPTDYYDAQNRKTLQRRLALSARQTW